MTVPPVQSSPRPALTIDSTGTAARAPPSTDHQLALPTPVSALGGPLFASTGDFFSNAERDLSLETVPPSPISPTVDLQWELDAWDDEQAGDALIWGLRDRCGSVASSNESLQSFGSSPTSASSPAYASASGTSLKSDRSGVNWKALRLALKRYICESCGSAFTTSGHLIRHRKLHLDGKKYACLLPECPARFTRKDNMKQHLKSHAAPTGRSRLKISNETLEKYLLPQRPKAVSSRLRSTKSTTRRQGSSMDEVFSTDLRGSEGSVRPEHVDISDINQGVCPAVTPRCVADVDDQADPEEDGVRRMEALDFNNDHDTSLRYEEPRSFALRGFEPYREDFNHSTSSLSSFASGSTSWSIASAPPDWSSPSREGRRSRRSTFTFSTTPYENLDPQKPARRWRNVFDHFDRLGSAHSNSPSPTPQPIGVPSPWDFYRHHQMPSRSNFVVPTEPALPSYPSSEDGPNVGHSPYEFSVHYAHSSSNRNGYFLTHPDVSRDGPSTADLPLHREASPYIDQHVRSMALLTFHLPLPDISDVYSTAVTSASPHADVSRHGYQHQRAEEEYYPDNPGLPPDAYATTRTHQYRNAATGAYYDCTGYQARQNAFPPLPPSQFDLQPVSLPWPGPQRIAGLPIPLAPATGSASSATPLSFSPPLIPVPDHPDLSAPSPTVVPAAPAFETPLLYACTPPGGSPASMQATSITPRELMEAEIAQGARGFSEDQ